LAFKFEESLQPDCELGGQRDFQDYKPCAQ